MERSVYTDAIQRSREWVKDLFTINGTFNPPPLFSDHLTVDTCRHLSFDFAQNIAYPYNPLQPGPLYFLCPQKVHLFGICCEAIPRQVNYLIDEAFYTGKGANTVISLLHHYLCHHSLGETQLHLHADNCVGQNKNNYLLRVSMITLCCTDLLSTFNLVLCLAGVMWPI